jgi:hypothetical protein
MKKRIPHRQIPGKNVRKGREARTGEHCPVNGWWAPAGKEAEAQYITEGSIMPPSNNRSVAWTLAATRMAVRQPRHIHPAPGASIDSL